MKNFLITISICIFFFAFFEYNQIVAKDSNTITISEIDKLQLKIKQLDSSLKYYKQAHRKLYLENVELMKQIDSLKKLFIKLIDMITYTIEHTNRNFTNHIEHKDLGYIDYVKIIQIVDSNNMIVELEGHRDKTAWIRELNTDKYQDDKRIAIFKIFVASGNKTYTTSLGNKNTVILLEPEKEFEKIISELDSLKISSFEIK